MTTHKDENGLDKNYHYEQGENIIIEEDENENSNENNLEVIPQLNESNENNEEGQNLENKISSINEEEEEEEIEDEKNEEEDEEKELTKEEKEKNMEIKEAFNVFDKDCDGFITTLDELIKQYDKDESGTIDLNEFMDLMNNKLKEQQEGQELLETFQIFDKDADGTISADDLKYVIKAVGEELEDYLIEELIEQGDRDHDGKINYHEFVRIMTSK